MLIGTLYFILVTSYIVGVAIEVIGSLGDDSAVIPDKLSEGTPGLQDPDNNFDVSMWLFSSDRTVEELEQFARTGVIPHVSPKPDKGNFSVQDNQLFIGNGREWVPVTTPGTIQHYPAPTRKGEVYKDTIRNQLVKWDGSEWKSLDDKEDREVFTMLGGIKLYSYVVKEGNNGR
jgi:hypothetical protein